jgi:Mg-chelatase subunit ChlD
MNPEMSQKPQDELESSLTALLLGELPHEQAAALHQKLAQDAELAKVYERLKQTVNLVRETIASPAAQAGGQPTPLKLSDQRRQKLLQHFKTVAPKEFTGPRRRARRWLVPVGIAAALALLLASISVPNFTKARSTSMKHSFGTWSLSQSVAPMPLAADKPVERRLRFMNPSQSDAPQAAPGRTVKAEPPAPLVSEPPPPPPAASPVIVLPQSGELADVTGTPPVLKGVNSWDASGANKEFYDASSGRADGGRSGGGFGGSGAFGSSGGSARGGAATAEHDFAIRQAYVPLAPPTANGTVEAPSPATVPSPIMTGAPAPAAPATSSEVGGTEQRVFRLANANASETADQLTQVFPPSTPSNMGGSGGPGGNTSIAINGGDRTEKLGFMQAVPDPRTSSIIVTADKNSMPQIADMIKELDSDKGRKEVVGTLDLQNAAPQDVYNNLQGLFQRSNVRPQNDNANPMLGQPSPLYQREKANTQPAIQGTPSGFERNLGTGNANLPSANPSGRFPGGALLGPREFGPGGGDQGVTQDRPVLRSPKDRGLMGGSGGAAAAPAPSSAQETAVNEAVIRQAKRVPTPQNAPAFKGTPKDVFALGDVPVVGGLFQGTPGAKGGSDQANIGGTARTYPSATTNGEAYFSLDPETRRVVKLADEDTGKQIDQEFVKRSVIVLPKSQGETSLALLNKDVGQDFAYLKAPSDSQNARVQNSDVSRELLAAVPQPIAAPAALEDTRKQRGEEAAKQPPPQITLQRITTSPKPAASAPVPQPEVQTAGNAFSTFSLNVSDVSFKLAAASLEKSVMPEPATVRSEEFINAFDYRDPEPPPGVPVAFAWERARYPFAQNRDLLRFSIKTAAQGRQPGRPLNLVLLLDNSGSMERADRVQIIHEALRVLAGQLQPQDKFSVVTFARTAHLWVDGASGSQAAQVAEEVSGLTPHGGTNLEDAMNLAYQTALRHYLANGINRVVLLTDGAANLGNVDPEALKQKVEAHRKQGVALDCFGIGWEGYNDDLLEVLSRNGDGRYAFLNTPEEAAGEFAAKLAGALQVAASDVKVQVEFNPGRVTAYRQIGYAKHQLTKEQFRDNTVNAAQIGAAEAGNALYVVEVNPNGAGPLGTVRARFRIPGTADYREHAWDVPFNGSAVALEQASPAMRLAATGSAFAEWLGSSPYAAEATPDRLLGYLSGVPEVYGADARPKKLEWMIRQAKSIAGK